ncbi:MAG TPA: nuclear transport factor 2 family protein [Chloroflexota bacterium]|jgi:hypothetical protein|nr:nuclear transport factor 2 family protein [Chloroflexota bacterium]
MLRIWLAMGVGAVFLIGSGIVASMARAQASGDPAAVITAYEMARNRRDIDAALTYFADDASVSVRNTMYSGKDEIRKYLDGPITRSRVVVVSDRRATGTHVTWTERAGTQASGQGQQLPGQAAGNNGGAANTPNSFAVNVEAVVQDGKIRSLNYLTGNQAARTDPALEGRAQLPATVGLGAVLVILLGLVVFASIGLRRSTAGGSTLQGTLMQDLQGWTSAREPL